MSADSVGRPKRIERKRTKGWKMPPNTIYVGRPTRWGSPYKIGQYVHRGLCFTGRDEFMGSAEIVVAAYRKWIWTQKRIEDVIPELRGKNLACFCPLDQPCHADVLLEIANAER